MRVREVRDLVDRRPFRPFRVWVSDGSSHDVADPGLVLVTKDTVYFLGYEEPDDELPSVERLLDPIHITRVERLRTAD